MLSRLVQAAGFTARDGRRSHSQPRRWLPRRAVRLSAPARAELLLHGVPAQATVTRVRGEILTLWIDPPSGDGYETRLVRSNAGGDGDAVEAMLQAGDELDCRIDPGDPRRVALRPLLPLEDSQAPAVTKILADGRRARATVLAAAPVDASSREPVLRLDLEMLAWDEPAPWRVRVVAAVPLAAVPLAALGQKLVVAFFAVDKGESVAIDWAVSAEMFGGTAGSPAR